MSSLMRRPEFNTTIDFLIELPLIIVESILKMSLDKANYKALKYVIASTSALTTTRREILCMIDRIISERNFLMKQLTFDIQINNMVTENGGIMRWDKCKFIDSDEKDVLEDLMHGYQCIQHIHPRLRPYYTWDSGERISVVILDFWKMYSRSRDKDLVQQIINAMRLAVNGGRRGLHGKIQHISFKTRIICKEIQDTAKSDLRLNGRNLDIFLRLELIALNYTLFRHVERKFIHGGPMLTTRHGTHRCQCPNGIWKHENCGTMTSWSFVETMIKGKISTSLRYT